MREVTLARRLSQHIPKSSSTQLPFIPPSTTTNTASSVSSNVTITTTTTTTTTSSSSPSSSSPSSEKASFKRTSLQQGQLQQPLDNPADPDIFNVTPASSRPPSASVPGPIVTRARSSSSSPHPSARNTPPISTNPRTQLGSILASSLGHAGGPGSPVSPSSNSSSRHFRYPSSTPPPAASTINSAATFDTSKVLPPTRKPSAMSDGKNDKSSGGSGIGSNLKNYAPSVFINIGKTTSSLPQIVMPKKRVAQNIASNLSYIAAWYFFSTALSIYNKNLMGKDNWNFNLPLFVSSVHAGLHFVITACLMHFFPDKYDATRSGKGGRLTIHSYVTQVVPCAIAAALEICMANASLMYITLSFYTMIKSSTPIWVLIFAFFFRLEKPRLSLILIIGVIVIGVVLTVAGETQFDMTGFVLVLLAAVMSGLRWSLTQMLLQKDQLGMDNPVATLYYISPIMFVLMSLLSLIIEDPFVQFASSEFFTDFRTGSLTLMMAAGGGFLAFAMTVAEFKLIKNTGTVTLSVAGISKEIVVISLSILIFGDRLTFVNLLGLLVSIGGIMAYNYDKIKKMQHSSGDYEPLGPIGRHHKGDNTD
ncbi:Triose-phosphate Transporter [Mortierella sp. AM989]|nr:Triose-phosphate Transporter [Mortierella sp. AM989]